MKIAYRIALGGLCILLLQSCQEKAPVSYESAIAKGKIDTTLMIRKNDSGRNDTTKMPHLAITSIINAQLPSFEAKLMDGRTVNDDYFKDKVSVINLWFIGCQPCEAEMPGFNVLVEKYKSQPVKFLAISRNEPDDLTEFFQTHPFHADQMALGELIIQDVFKHTWGYPMTIVADKTGKIVYAKAGGVPTETAVQHIQEELIPIIEKAL